MNRRDLQWFLVIEVFAIVWAGALFSTVESKFLAGALAGGYFVLSGLYMLYRVMQWPERWSSLVLYSLIIHVFAISIPMLLQRFLQRDLDFVAVRVMGLTGPQFHQLSSLVFSMLIVATVIDWLRCWWAARNTAHTVQNKN